MQRGENHADNRTVAYELVVVAELSPMIAACKEKAQEMVETSPSPNQKVPLLTVRTSSLSTNCSSIEWCQI